MSWQAVSFLILAAVLIGGFAWYERSRPPAQVVALVAALAALAVAGRVAFAAVPNVVATTDIVLFAGYALGAAPGFAVGALTGLVANLWLGQGPWTPWQMAGWGLCGVLGALLALRRRDIGRLGLAAACGGAAVAYGLLLNFSLMATYGGELSVDRFLALEASSVPFDLAHAAGNVTLALIAGPAIVRMLIRFRQRFEWERRPAASGRLRGGAVAAVLLLAAAVSASATQPAQAGPRQALSWLASQQNSDGGFGASPGRESGAEMTAWAMLGLEAAGKNPLDMSRGGSTPVDFLRKNLGEVHGAADLARTILALEGAGVDSQRFGGRNLVADLRDRRRKSGSYLGWPTTSAFAVIALRAAGARKGLEPTIAWLAKAQNGDGGWGDTPGSPSNPDSTGSVMQAMASTDAARRGLRYLRRHQHADGGFALGGFGGVNSQSTAWAAQGMVAVGANPGAIRRKGHSPLDYLAARQAPDGHYRYSRSSDQTPVWVTGQALVAVARDSFPIAAPPREPQAPAPQQSAPTVPAPVPVPAAPVPAAPPSGGAFPVPSSPGGSSAAPQSGAPGVPSAPSPSGAPGAAGDPFAPEGDTGASGPAAGVAAATPAKENDRSPAAPVGVGLATGIVALGGTVLLGRRFRW